jgi:ribonuclease HII
VILPTDWLPTDLDDSKQLTPARREDLAVRIRARAVAWAACAVGPRVIETENILAATLQAMARSVARLCPAPDLVLVDGLQTPPVACTARALVKGDATSAAVAAASVLAKVLRDRVMVAWDRRYPGYGFAAHKGYGAPVHREALQRLGPCILHRRTYKPIAALDQTRLWNDPC